MDQVINTVAQKSQSDLLLFMIIIAVVAVMIGVPLYKQFITYLEKRDEVNTKREDKLLNVIQGNSSIISELKSLLTSNNENCRTCKTDQLSYFKSMDGKQNELNLIIKDMENHVDIIVDKLKSEKLDGAAVLNRLDGLLDVVKRGG